MRSGSRWANRFVVATAVALGVTGAPVELQKNSGAKGSDAAAFALAASADTTAPAAYDGAGADASPEVTANLQQAEASIEQVEKDLSRMSTFAAEVKRTVDQEEHAKADVTHALGYFRRQMELHAGERDVAAAHISRVEAEVVSLQRRVKDLEAQAKECEAQKSALAEAKTTVLAQLAKLSEGVGRITAGEAPQW